jgi:hypothetical protein
MYRFILLVAFSAVNMPAWSSSLPSPLPDTLYFEQSWCPKKDELSELSKHLELTMNGCCILKATSLAQTIANPAVLAPWADKIYTRNSDLGAPCVGLSEEEEALKAEQARIETERRLASIPTLLRTMSPADFCVSYGMAIRDEEIDGFGVVPNLLKLVKKESSRRKLKFSDALVTKGLIKIGSSECQLYASWGLPEDQNRTVGGWGVHIQHIYGNGTYVYTENGRVTSWQD